jgi:purine-binding chemotaxis protein CheW
VIDDTTTAASSDKYLIYQLGTQFFATPLIEVREVIEFRDPKPIPHTAPYFKGVINIRGEIVGVIDLRERLNIQSEHTPVAQLVFETPNGPLAGTVDRVQSVTIIQEADLDKSASAQATGAGSDRAYFVGVGKLEDYLISVISLRNILNSDQLTTLPTAQQP